MNDENKMPVPDEAQAFPAHAEDDIATLEREAALKGRPSFSMRRTTKRKTRYNPPLTS